MESAFPNGSYSYSHPNPGPCGRNFRPDRSPRNIRCEFTGRGGQHVCAFVLSTCSADDDSGSGAVLWRVGPAEECAIDDAQEHDLGRYRHAFVGVRRL